MTVVANKRVKDNPEFKIYIISTQTFKFSLHHVILNDSSCQWNIRDSFVEKKNQKVVRIIHAHGHQFKNALFVCKECVIICLKMYFLV